MAHGDSKPGTSERSSCIVGRRGTSARNADLALRRLVTAWRLPGCAAVCADSGMCSDGGWESAMLDNEGLRLDSSSSSACQLLSFATVFLCILCRMCGKVYACGHENLSDASVQSGLDSQTGVFCCTIFSRDITLCGWLCSKHQLTNYSVSGCAISVGVVGKSMCLHANVSLIEMLGYNPEWIHGEEFASLIRSFASLSPQPPQLTLILRLISSAALWQLFGVLNPASFNWSISKKYPV